MLSLLDILREEAVAYDLLVLSESWLKSNISNESTNFLPPFRKDRQDRVGGGVVIYISM